MSPVLEDILVKDKVLCLESKRESAVYNIPAITSFDVEAGIWRHIKPCTN